MVAEKKPTSSHKKSVHFLMFVDAQKTHTFSISTASFKRWLCLGAGTVTILAGSGVYALESQGNILALKAQIQELKAGAVATHFIFDNELKRKETASNSELFAKTEMSSMPELLSKTVLHAKINSVAKNIESNTTASLRNFENSSKFAELKNVVNQLSMQGTANDKPLDLKPEHQQVPAPTKPLLFESQLTVAAEIPAPKKIPFSTRELSVEGNTESTDLAVTLVRDPKNIDMKSLIGHVCLNLVLVNGQSSPCVQKKRVSYSAAKKTNFTLNENIDNIAKVSFEFVPTKTSPAFESKSAQEEWESLEY